jgi:hypothetical protein
LIVGCGLASPRRLDDLMARFRHAGYVVSVAAPVDHRVRILTPTERLLAHDREHLAVIASCTSFIRSGAMTGRMASNAKAREQSRAFSVSTDGSGFHRAAGRR